MIIALSHKTRSGSQKTGRLPKLIALRSNREVNLEWEKLKQIKNLFASLLIQRVLTFCVPDFFEKKGSQTLFKLKESLKMFSRTSRATWP